MRDDVVAPRAVADPHRFFRELRESDPVHWSERHRAWILTRFSDVEEALSDERLSTDNITPLQKRMSAAEQARFEPAAKLLRSWMIFNDGEAHRRLREPVRAAFKPHSVEKLRGQIEDLVDDALDRLATLPSVDLIRDFAFPIPATVIALLLGVPENRQEEFKSWSKMLGALVIGKVERADVWNRALEATHEFTEFFSLLIEEYERKPGDNLISRLIAARDQGSTLRPDQVVGACTLLLFGGHETTTNLIASGTLALLQHGEAFERLRSDPDLIGPAVEEMVRFDGPSKIVVRRVKIPHTRHGARFETGQAVFLSTAAANRDPAVFTEPDRFDITRAPNRHLGFGWGRHFCLGAQLARLEAQVAIGRLVKHFPNLRLATSDLSWHPTILGRALRELPVVLGVGRDQHGSAA